MTFDRSKVLNRLLVIFDEAKESGYSARIVNSQKHIFALEKDEKSIIFYDYPPFNTPDSTLKCII